MEANYVQKRMEEMQKSEDFSNVLGKVLSGRPGYRAVVEKKKINIKCQNCGMAFESPPKFCPECGAKIEMPKKA